MGIVRFALRFPHTFYVIATLVVFLGSVASAPSSSKDGLTGFRKGITARCPGAAAQSAPDKSNPYKPDRLHCKLEDLPR